MKVPMRGKGLNPKYHSLGMVGFLGLMRAYVHCTGIPYAAGLVLPSDAGFWVQTTTQGPQRYSPVAFRLSIDRTAQVFVM